MTAFSLWKLAVALLIIRQGMAQPVPRNDKKELSVIAYYSGNGTDIDPYAVQKLTHLIYSFVPLKGNRLYVSPAAGTIIKRLVSLKRKHPSLKVLVAFAGWGGCKNCSVLFASPNNCSAFARSVKEILQTWQLDGIDLDWEYPAVQGPVGHPFAAADKQHFTTLIKTLRTTLGNNYEISFAAGAFTDYLQQSVEWQKVAPLVDRINLMTYDLVNRNSLFTGHHAGLYSTVQQKESTDNAVRYLDSLHIPLSKLVIGAACYARVYEQVKNTNNGLYQSGRFQRFVVYKSYNQVFTPRNGYTLHWDAAAHAPYSYHAGKKLFATFDDIRSVKLKTQYALNKGLNGIMFWELRQDKTHNGLLDAIYGVKRAGSWESGVGRLTHRSHEKAFSIQAVSFW
jgi:chitinase